MSLFGSLFKKKKKDVLPIPDETSKVKIDDEWEDLPAFIETNPEEYELVSVIATAIAAGDKPESQFVVKNIKVRNPEVRTVSIIASALASEMTDGANLSIKRIAQKRK
ncbi:MAG: hypothetical protein LBV67_01295 [Streptococcaceae bacterium]|jgi:hypothetical protein|nr:hypothetical protein [Streptococcaceae bacterium]